MVIGFIASQVLEANNGHGMSFFPRNPGAFREKNLPKNKGYN
ncbi:hypothetical protein ES703_66648 [subsurface metagenome]